MYCDPLFSHTTKQSLSSTTEKNSTHVLHRQVSHPVQTGFPGSSCRGGPSDFVATTHFCRELTTVHFDPFIPRARTHAYIPLLNIKYTLSGDAGILQTLHTCTRWLSPRTVITLIPSLSLLTAHRCNSHTLTLAHSHSHTHAITLSPSSSHLFAPHYFPHPPYPTADVLVWRARAHA